MTTPSGVTRFRIVLVEEDAELARVVLGDLARAGMQCYHGADPQAGFEAFEKNSPHLMLLSLGLPRIGGAVLCPKIRAVSMVPIMILSVRTRREDQLHALNIGADDFVLVRPLDEPLLVARILTLLRRVYRYDRQAAEPDLDTEAVQTTRPQPPPDWVTCEACDYMGPSRRFEKLDVLGNRSMICPHCNQAQTLKYTLG